VSGIVERRAWPGRAVPSPGQALVRGRLEVDALTTTLTLAALLLVVLLWAAWTFNLLVRRRNGVSESWATIDVELTRRHELIPQLVASVRGYAGFEASILSRVTDARARAVGGAQSGEPDAVAETALTDAVRSIFMVAEAYPDLKASQNFQSLQQDLALTEDRIAYARAVYNAWVTEYETTRQVFPSMIIARLFRFESRPFFEADTSARVPVAVSLAS
jgi:LemA protein